jgi:hypothetical protein
VSGPGATTFGVGATENLRSLLGATVITVAGRDWTGRDLVTAGALSGRWRMLETDLARGLTSVEIWRPQRELVKSVLRDFRYARRLISAEEFSDWLRQRKLTLEELTEAIERRLARERGAEAPACGHADQRHGAFAALPAEAVYTGALLDCAQWLTDRMLCLADGSGCEPEPAKLEKLLERERGLMAAGVSTETDGERRARAELMLAAGAAYDARVAQLCSAGAISKLVRSHALDWQRFELITFAGTTPGAAAEIAALAREGASAGLIAEVSGVPAELLRLYLEEAPAAIQGWLGGAVAGAVIGPVGEQGTYRTWLVRARQAPDPEDPSIAARAGARIVEKHLRGRRAGTVRWHERH